MINPCYKIAEILAVILQKSYQCHGIKDRYNACQIVFSQDVDEFSEYWVHYYVRFTLKFFSAVFSLQEFFFFWKLLNLPPRTSQKKNNNGPSL